MIYDNVKIGERIREERKKLFLSKMERENINQALEDEGDEGLEDRGDKVGVNQDDFATILRVKSKDTISDWENGKRVPPLNKMLLMCKFFDCELGYLLGEYDCKTRAASDIQNITGLSEETINVLIKLHKASKRPSLNFMPHIYKQRLDAINLLIENELSGFNFFEYVSIYLWHDYEALPLAVDKGFHPVDEESKKALEEKIAVREKNSGTRYSFPIDMLSQAAIMSLQDLLQRLKREVTDNGEHNQTHE